MIHVFYKSKHIKRSHIDDAVFDVCKNATHLGSYYTDKNWVVKVEDSNDEGGYFLDTYDSDTDRKILIQPKWEQLICDCCGSEDEKVTGYTVINDFKVTQNQTDKTDENELLEKLERAKRDYDRLVDQNIKILKLINKAK